MPTDEETQGRTSEYIGNFLASSSAVGREDVVLATKVCGYSQRLGWWRGGPPTPVGTPHPAPELLGAGSCILGRG